MPDPAAIPPCFRVFVLAQISFPPAVLISEKALIGGSRRITYKLDRRQVVIYVLALEGFSAYAPSPGQHAPELGPDERAETHMKVVRVSEFGPPEALRLDDAAEPRPAAGAVVIEIETIGLGYMDTAARRGEGYLATSPGFIPGYEVAGIVIDVAADVEDAWLGSRVFAVLRQGGGCAERVELPVDELMPLPEQVSYEDAVATGLNALVAQVGLARVPIAATDQILIRGAGGGIGLMCVQYASLRGRTIVATTSSKERGERLVALGASSIWNRLTGDQEGPESFDVIVDTVVGEEFPAFLDKLGSNGHYLICGSVGGMPPSDFGMKIVEHFHKSPTLHAFSLNSASVDEVAREAAAVFQHVRAGRIFPVIDSVMPLTEIVAAHRKLEAGQAFGKIILRPDLKDVDSMRSQARLLAGD